MKNLITEAREKRIYSRLRKIRSVHCVLVAELKRLIKFQQKKPSPHGIAAHCRRRKENKMATEMYSTIDQISDIPVDRLIEICQAEQEGRLVVLPCRVGDIIYGYPFCWAEETISEHGILEWKVACIHCSVNKAGKTRATVRATVWRQYNGNEYAYITEDIPFEDFGKTVFLTREEAEAALKGTST